MRLKFKNKKTFWLKENKLFLKGWNFEEKSIKIKAWIESNNLRSLTFLSHLISPFSRNSMGTEEKSMK